MSGKHKYSQTKGRAFELWVLKKEWEAVGKPWPWKPHERPDGGATSPPEFQHIHQEMKRQERLNFWDAVKQAKADAKREKRREWAVIARRNRDSPVVVLDFNTWLAPAYSVRGS